MGDVGSYQRWWPWLRSFEARALASGEAWHCTVRPPLPYTVKFTIAFEDVVAERYAQAHVSGDVAGDATLTLDDTDLGCVVVVRSNLSPRSTFLRLLASTFPPVARYGHDWVLSTGADQFAMRALNADERDTTT